MTIIRRGVSVGLSRQLLSALLPELITNSGFALQIFQGVFKINTMLLEETVDFHAYLVTQQAAHLRFSELARAIPLKGYSFQHSACDILTLWTQLFGQVIGYVQNDSHDHPPRAYPEVLWLLYYSRPLVPAFSSGNSADDVEMNPGRDRVSRHLHAI